MREGGREKKEGQREVDHEEKRGRISLCNSHQQAMAVWRSVLGEVNLLPPWRKTEEVEKRERSLFFKPAVRDWPFKSCLALSSFFAYVYSQHDSSLSRVLFCLWVYVCMGALVSHQIPTLSLTGNFSGKGLDTLEQSIACTLVFCIFHLVFLCAFFLCLLGESDEGLIMDERTPSL